MSDALDKVELGARRKLGIIIGVVSLVVLVSLVSNATTSVTDEISSLGNSMLTVNISDNKDDPMTLDDLYELAENEEFSAVAPLAQASVTAKIGYTSTSVSILGTTPSYAEIQGLELENGRFLKTTDVDNATYIAVLNQDAAEALFETTNVVGETVTLDGMKFTIVGVLKEDESVTSSFSSGSMIYVPYTTACKLSDSISEITSFYAASGDENSLDAAEAVLTQYLLERSRQDKDAFTINNQSTLMETMSSVTNTLALLLGGIAGISLLVGGIGIMNIMLVSVTERTREIGIRKAIGAGRGSIMIQFLIEALVVCMMGCFIGILCSWGILQIVSMFSDCSTYQLSSSIVVIAIAFSTGIGIIFGIYPANKAAKKRLIEALRYEG